MRRGNRGRDERRGTKTEGGVRSRGGGKTGGKGKEAERRRGESARRGRAERHGPRKAPAKPGTAARGGRRGWAAQSRGGAHGDCRRRGPGEAEGERAGPGERTGKMELERETAGARPPEPWTEVEVLRCTVSAPGWGGRALGPLAWKAWPLPLPPPHPATPPYGWLGLSLPTCEVGVPMAPRAPPER